MIRRVRRLAFVTDANGFGGAERYIVDMTAAAKRRKIDSCVWWLKPANVHRNVFDMPETAGLEVTTIEAASVRTWPGFAGKFRAMLHDQKPDALVINASGRPRYWLTAHLARWAQVPAVWVHQMVDGRDYRRIPARWLGGRIEGPQWWRIPQTLRHQLAEWAAQAIVTLTAQDRDRIIRRHAIPAHRIRVVPHGVDGERFRFDAQGRDRCRRAWGIADEQRFVLGTACRLVNGKGVELLIAAMAALRGCDNVSLVIAGEGPQREAFETLAIELGVRDRVWFAGFVTDMPAFYSALDAFALCSSTESFGLALAEAMACERPVIGTPTAGAERQIEHHVSGWQLRGFEPAELGAAIETLAGDAPRCKRMGQAARTRALTQFGIELTLERTLRALRGSAGGLSTLQWPGMNEAHFAQMSTEDLNAMGNM